MRCKGLVVAAVASSCALVASTTQASAAVTLGETFTPTEICASNTFLQTLSPTNAYVVPTRGVITSWRMQGGPDAGVVARFKAGRAAGGDSYSIVGQSPTHPIAPNVLNAFADRVPVQAGDQIGLWVNSTTECYRLASGFASASKPGDVQPGAPSPFTPSAGGQFNVAATVEPDADGDGFGDETQDGCPIDAATNGACIIPETSIDARPRNKVRRGRVIYEFSANVPEATFECSFDGPYEPCSSPAIYRARSGRHKFLVRAYDRFGVADSTPAVDKFKAKRKKRRKK